MMFQTALKKFDDGSSSSEQSALSPPNKRVKSQSYTIPDDIMKLIMKDTLNERLWNDVQINAKEGVKVCSPYMTVHHIFEVD